MNSKGTTNIAAAIDAESLAPDTITDPSTSDVKHCHIYVPFKKMLRPMDKNNVMESGGGIIIDQLNPYAFDKLHPLTNVWCLLSTDDQSAVGSTIITGDAVCSDTPVM